MNSQDRARAALRRARGTMSLQAFVNLLLTNGYPGQLSRQRLSRIEQGRTHPSPATWNAIADALQRAGRNPTDVAALRPDDFVIEPLPPITPQIRAKQWSRVVEGLPRNRWWQNPTMLLARAVGRDWQRSYGKLYEEYGTSREWHRAEVRRRLEAGTAADDVTGKRDGVSVHPDSRLAVRTEKVGLFVLKARLRNIGEVPWRDRMLYRLGPPVSSSLPFMPAVLPMPDTDPGDECDVIMPGRAQWFPNLAVVSYVMVLTDCTPCLPGRLRCSVDTRAPGEYDRTLALPPEK